MHTDHVCVQVMSYKKHTDYISDAALHERERALVVTSGDGTLSVHDLRAGAYKFRARRCVYMCVHVDAFLNQCELSEQTRWTMQQCIISDGP